MKVPMDEFYRMLERIAKATTLAGATAAETTGALRQLGQAFGANRLSGQELNSILEQLPIVVDVIADQMGVARGAVRAMANEGKIGAREILKAFGDTGKGVTELELRFSRLAPTLGQAFTILNDRLMLTLGNIFRVTGAADGFSASVLAVAGNMDYLIGPITTLFTVITAGLVSSTLAQNLFNAAVLRNPYVLGISIFLGAIAGLAAISEKSETLRKVWEVLGNTVTSVILFVAKGLTGWADLIGLNTEAMHRWIDETEKAMGQGNNLMDSVGDKLSKIRDHTASLSDEANEFDKRWEELWRSGKNGIESNISAMNRLIMSAEEYNRELSKMGGAKIIHVRTRGTSQSDINRIPGTSSANLPDYYASGGNVTGPAGRDRVPAMLTAGEFVVNKDASSKFRGLLEQINKPKGYAEGGLATGEYLPLGQEPRESHSLRIGGRDWEGLTASGFIPSFKPGGHLWEFTGIYGPEVLAKMAAEKEKVKAWRNELTAWWSTERANILPIENRQPVDNLVTSWKAGLPKYVVDPREFIEANTMAGNQKNPAYDRLTYHFENVAKKLAQVGWAAPILARTDVWGDTLGKYVSYSGPDYGTNVAYGGDLNEKTAETFIRGLEGFARGGRFTVGGSGGPDSQLVQFMASPGEQVSVKTPQQQQSTGVNVTVNMNITGSDVQAWQRSENQVVGSLARKIKAYVEQNGLQ